MRKSNFYFISMAVATAFVCLMFVHAALTVRGGFTGIQEKTAVVRTLQLTDLCLFTEARYTRHLSQADLHTAFQDHPVSLEHFPSGSLVSPPSMVSRTP